MNSNSLLDIRILCTIISLLTWINGDKRCPDPDKHLDYADKNKTISRPPASFTYFNTTFIGAFSAEVNWSQPLIGFSTGEDHVIEICHYNLKISYKPQQKDSLMRYTHMNINSTQFIATINHLTPNTEISISLSACFLFLKPSDEQEYVCSKGEKLTFSTENNSCNAGYYSTTNNSTNSANCTDCLCSNKSVICEDGTGKCLDCLYNSHGDWCENCLDGYELNDENVCESIEDHTNLLDTTTLPDIEFNSTTVKSSAITLNSTNLVSLSTRPSTNHSNSTQSKHFNVTDSQSNRPTVTNSQLNYSTSTDSQSNTSLITVSTLPTTTHEHHKHLPNHSYDFTTIHNDHTSGSMTVVIAVCSVVALFLITFVAVLIYRRYKSRRKIPVNFWTMQLQNNSNNTSVAFSDIADPHDIREDNILLDNDFNNRNRVLSFATDENPYRQLTAQT